MSENFNHPFRGELETHKEGVGFEVHKLKDPFRTVDMPEGQEKDFENSEYAITEYFTAPDKDHQEFVRLKKFYEAAKSELGEFLPESFFVEGNPSQNKKGKSFYVIQRFPDSEFNKTAKKLEELNTQEFTVDFLNQLLEIQERINSFLEKHAAEIPDGWFDQGVLDPHTFKEDVLRSPQNFTAKIANLFRLDPETTKHVIGSDAEFKPTKDRLKMLKMLGLAGVVEKIDRAIERSAAPEWIKGRDIHWKLDSEKLEQEGKKAMALTFDDGPNEETEILLDILKAQNVKATFFLVGSLIEGQENIVRRIIAEGHDIGVHEWGQEGASIKDLKKYAKRFVGPRTDLGDVKRTAKLIEDVGGVKPVLGRVAGVHGTIDSLREFQSIGLEIVHGSPYDVLFIPPTKKMSADKLLKRSLRNNGQGKIRIFHIGVMQDGGSVMDKKDVELARGEVYPPAETLKMIGSYIEASKKQGYKFVKVADYI